MQGFYCPPSFVVKPATVAPPSRYAGCARRASQILAFPAMSLAFALQAAPIHKAAKRITDAQGRTRVIVDFVDQARDVYPADSFPTFDLKKDRHQPQVQALVTAYEKRYGFKRAFMTSWVGASLTAYLTPKQIEQLSADANVRLLAEDYVGEFSAPPPWYPSWINGAPRAELSDWGRNAVNGKSVLPGSQRKVYIIDSGVAQHNDLASVLARVNVDANPPVVPAPVVGCYAHATHVAGIVGATVGNGKTRAGVYAGVNMVSVTAGFSYYQSEAASNCITTSTQLSASMLGLALDFIRWDTAVWQGYNSPVHIATMSLNSIGTGFNSDGTAQTNYSKLQQLVTRGFVLRYYLSPLCCSCSLRETRILILAA